MNVTTEIIAAFRRNYPIFSDLNDYPDDIVTLALCDGDVETGGSGWGVYVDTCGNYKQRGMFLYAAHWLTTTYPNGASNMSSTPRQIVSSKSVGDESISYDTTMYSGDNAWLMGTSFGQQWIRLSKRSGMGGRIA